MSNKELNLSSLRELYQKGVLDRNSIQESPMEQFSKWFKEALEAKIPEPNAMTLSTANEQGVPSSRTLLLKGLDEQGFTFFTNYRSRKSSDLAQNNQAALCFLWKELERQVCVRGVVQQVTREESEEYFHSRPYESQIGAWVSEQQSGVISRPELKEKEKELLKKYPAGTLIPLPSFWGGYRLIPYWVEFWQGRPSRLHDRIVYQRNQETQLEEGDQAIWTIERLSP